MQKLGMQTNKFSDVADGNVCHALMRGLYARMSSQAFTSGSIAQATTTTKVKTVTTTIHGIVNGLPVSVAPTDNFWTLSGVVADGKTNVFCLYVDAAGAASSAMGVEATTGTAGALNNNVKFPPMPENKMMVGFVIVSCSGGAFTGGTSNVATAGNFTVTFVNTVGMFDPTATI